MKIFIYSHTHWDREWYLSRNQFQFRLIRTLDEIMDMVEADNGFDTFVLDGQTSIIHDYLELRPEQESRLRNLIRKGQLIIGPWFTMPDLFLPDGESLIRNLQAGYRDCRSFDAPFPNVGYVPDSFGHIEQLPQIMQGVGIDNYIFGRGLPEAVRKDPSLRREFHWQAPDGSTVLCIFLPESYIGGRWLPPADDVQRLRKRMDEIIRPFQENTHVPDRVLVPHGIDHCWLQKDIPEILNTLHELYRDEADIHHGTLEAFVDDVKQAVRGRDLGTYSGQLRGYLKDWELNGTLSSRMDTKINNEWAQIHLESLAEPLDAVSSLAGRELCPAHLEKAWEKLLQNHAHDSICGCSQDHVHDDVNLRFREVIETGIDIADGALDYLNNNALRDGDPTVVLFAGLNGGTRLVDMVIRLAEPPGSKACLEDADGRHYPVQLDEILHMQTSFSVGEPVTYYECRGCVYIDDLQPCEIRRLRWVAEGDPVYSESVQTDGNTLSNGRIRIDVQENGRIHLTDLDHGFTHYDLHGFAHDTDVGGGYHFEPYPRSRRRTADRSQAVCRQVSQGPLRSVLEVTTSLKVPAGFDRETGTIKGSRTLKPVTRFTVEAGSRTVRVSTTLENTVSHHRLRVRFPSGKPQAAFHADAAFSVHENAIDRWPGEIEHQSHPLRNWCALQTAEGGLGIMTRGLHEYAMTRDRDGNLDLELTLLRSVDSTLLCCNWMTPDALLPGEQSFEYALTPFSGTWRDAGLPQQAAVYRAPAIANTHGDLPLRPSGPNDSFATTQYAEIKDGREVLRDPNRSAWKRIYSQRDGWKRIDQDRFLSRTLPRQICPFRLNGKHLTVSAFRRRKEGDGYILRVWSWHDRDQTLEISGPSSTSEFVRCSLLDAEQDSGSRQTGKALFPIRPFEILTVQIREP